MWFKYTVAVWVCLGGIMAPTPQGCHEDLGRQEL